MLRAIKMSKVAQHACWDALGIFELVNRLVGTVWAAQNP